MARYRSSRKGKFRRWLRRSFPGIWGSKARESTGSAPAEYRFLSNEEVKAALEPMPVSEDDIPASEIQTPDILMDSARPHLKRIVRKKRNFGQLIKDILASIGIDFSKSHSRRSHRKKKKTSAVSKSSRNSEFRLVHTDDAANTSEIPSEQRQDSGYESRPSIDTLPFLDDEEEENIFKRIAGFFRQLLIPASADDSSLQYQNQARTLNKRKHAQRRKRRRGYSRRWFGIFGKKRKSSPVAIQNPMDFKEPEKVNIPFFTYLRPVINSTAMFLIAYQLSWLIYQGIVMFVASINHIDSVLYFYEVMFPVGDTSPKWGQINILLITFSGPLISLAFWALYRYVLLKKLHPGAQMRLLLVWLTLTSMMLFFGSFVGGTITNQGFGYVANWLYMNIAFRILFSMIFLAIIILLSWKIVRFLPSTAGQDTWKNNRIGFILSRLVIPWILGTGIMLLLKITHNVPQHENIFDYDAINLATLAFAVIPPLFNTETQPHMAGNRKMYPRVHRTTIALWSILAIAFVVVVRIGLSYGLQFQFSISLHMGWYH